ncbi:hypothetical protein BGO17_00110 [Candidatus Saccharibacteria bacterium 49-20]|nr:MAG: hypothetical protein BGO17_00110 [Candidatus Saccharibacteria bacterium 49-20]
MNITLTTLNLQGFESWGTSDTWEKRVPNVVRYVNETKPDIICFQEIVYLPEISPFNPAQLLNQQLNYPFEASSITRLQVGRKYPVYREGLATLSKLTVTKTDTVVLKQAEGDAHNRIVQFIDVQLPDGGMLKIANVHFSITDYVDFATAHIQETINLIKARGEKRIIIGDFNHVRLEDLEDIWGEDYNSTSDVPYVTYPVWYEGPKHGPKRVDYALVPKEYEITSIAVSPDGLSDHRALTVTISLPN